MEQPVTCGERLVGASGEMSLTITAPDGRAVPLTILAPEKPGIYPLIAFSHGAFAAPARYRAMLAPLAGAGYIVLAPMHIDSEDFGNEAPPSHPETWRTRNADMALALAPPAEVTARLEQEGLAIDASRVVAMGHSYGALIAQLPGGALASEPDGSTKDRRNRQVDAVVAWSPPGPMPGLIAAQGWASLVAPSLTITGTADVLPGFIDDWRMHKASFDNAPGDVRELWVGEGVDHYFGGMFGREKAAPEASRRLLDRALAVTLDFIERSTGAPAPCALGPPPAGEQREKG